MIGKGNYYQWFSISGSFVMKGKISMSDLVKRMVKALQKKNEEEQIKEELKGKKKPDYKLDADGWMRETYVERYRY